MTNTHAAAADATDNATAEMLAAFLSDRRNRATVAFVRDQIARGL